MLKSQRKISFISLGLWSKLRNCTKWCLTPQENKKQLTGLSCGLSLKYNCYLRLGQLNFLSFIFTNGRYDKMNCPIWLYILTVFNVTAHILNKLSTFLLKTQNKTKKPQKHIWAVKTKGVHSFNTLEPFSHLGFDSDSRNKQMVTDRSCVTSSNEIDVFTALHC